MANLDERQVAAFVVEILFKVIAGITVIFRLWARHLAKSSLRTSDYLVVFGFLCSIAYDGVSLATVALGVGRHIRDVPRHNFSSLALLTTAGGIPGSLSGSSTRSSILFLYTELFPSRRFRWACWTLLGVTIAVTIAGLVLTAVNCDPNEYSLNPATRIPVRGNSDAVLITGVSISMSLDILIILLPQPIVWRLQMARAKKIIVSLLFSFGVIIIVTTILQVYFVVQLKRHKDATYYLYPYQITATLENALNIIGANLPVMRPVFSKIFKSLGTEVSRLSGKGSASESSAFPRSQQSLDNSGHRKQNLSYSEDENMVPLKKYPLQSNNQSIRQPPARLNSDEMSTISAIPPGKNHNFV